MGRRVNTAAWVAKENRWRVVVQKDGKRRAFHSSTPGRAGQREANARADAWLDENLHDGNMKFSRVWESYLAGVRETSGTSNYRQIKKFGEDYILPVCGEVKIGSLTEGQLQDVLDRAYKSGCLRPDRKQPKREEPLSRKTLQGIRATEMNFLKWGRQHHYTILHPETLTVPAGARLKGKRILQPDALRLLFDVDTRLMRGKREFDELIYAYRFEVSTGIRPGELLGLWVGDIKGRRVDLSRAINQYGETTQGKNENAIRSFDLNDYALAAYEAQLDLLKEMGFELNYNTPLFPVASEHTFYLRWRAYQESNGITPRVSLYELRHTFVSMVQDLPDGKLKLLVGHSRSMDTRGVYGHAVNGEDATTAADLSTLLGRFLG